MAGTIPGAGITTPLTLTTADNLDTLTLKSTDADANQGPVLNFKRDSSSPADDDILGQLTFTGENDASEAIEFVRIRAGMVDVTDGTEDSRYNITTYTGGSQYGRLNIEAGETVFNENSTDLDFRVESNGNTHMLFVDGGNNRVGVGTTPDLGAGLHVRVSDSGASVDGSYDTLVVEESGHSGIQILSGTSSTGLISFNDSGGVDRGYFGYAHSGDRMEFGVAGAEVMRITSTGQVAIGATPLSSSRLFFYASASTPYGLITQNNATTGSMYAAQFLQNNGSTELGSIKISNTATAFNTSSDYRLKENVVTDWDATTRLKQLKPSRFNFISDADTTVDGFLAHEVSSIVPEAISGDKDETETKTKVVVNSSGFVIRQDVEEADWIAGKVADEDGNTEYPTDSTWEASKVVPVYQGIDQSKLVPLMVKTIQELEARIKTLEDA